MLEYETFVNGLTFIMKCYKNFEFDKEEAAAWYQLIQEEIDEEAFLPLVMKYCKTESSPTGPSDLIKFSKKLMADSFPAPAFVARELIEAVKQMQHDDNFIYSDPDPETVHSYLISYIVSRNSVFRQKNVYYVIFTLIKQYSEVIQDVAYHNERTEISILISEIKTSYRKELDKTVSHSILSVSALEGTHPQLLT